MLKEKLPIEINYRDLARFNGSYQMHFSLEELPRLAKLVEKAVVDVNLVFVKHQLNYAVAQGHIEAKIDFICQRSLANYEQVIDQAFNLVILPREKDIERLTNAEDFYIAENGKLNLLELISEELLLALPMIPKQFVEIESPLEH